MKRLSAIGLDAMGYGAERGWCVFPCAGKLPCTAHACLDATTHPEAIADWWDARPDRNIAVRTGAPSNLVIVDVDGDDGARALAAFGPLPRTVRSTTGKGEHLWFAHPGVPVPNSAGRLGPQLDVRGDGGYIIAPPSAHPSGRRYAWVPGLSPEEIDPAPFPAVLLEQLVRAPEENEEHIHRDALAPSTALREIVRGASSVAEAVDRTDRRVQAYLSHVGCHVEGTRNNAAFQVAAWLLRDFALPRPVAAAYLAEWNSRNLPPLAARELRAAFASAEQHGRRPIGCAHRDRGAAA